MQSEACGSLNLKIVKEVFTRGFPASKFSAAMEMMMPWAVKEAQQNEHIARFLAAALYLCAPELLKGVDPPAKDRDNIAEWTAAATLWGWAMNTPYNLIRKACYTAADKENQEKALQFWRIAIRQGHKNIPVNGGHDFIGWSNTLDQSDDLVSSFMKVYTWDEKKSKGNQPIECAMLWKSPTEVLVYTSWGMPPNQKRIPMWAEIYKNRKFDYQTKITLNKDRVVEFSVTTTGEPTRQTTAMYLAGALSEFIADGEHRKFVVKTDEKARVVLDHLLAAMTIYDRGMPAYDGSTYNRKDTTTYRHGVFIGLAEARVSNDYREVWPVMQSPVLQKAKVNLSEEDAKVLRHYMHYSNIAEGENPPPGLRLAGVEGEPTHD